MLKRLVCAAAVLAVVGVVCAKAVKIRDFLIYEPDPDADAMAILNYVPAHDMTIVQVTIHSFEIGRTGVDAYDVILVSPSLGTATNKRVLETGVHGNGHVKLEIQNPFLAADNDWRDSTVYIGLDLNYNGGAVTGEIRAIGAPGS